MSPFQTSVQLALIGFDDGYIVALDAELATPDMFAQTGRFDCSGLLLLRIRESETFSASAHLGSSRRSRSSVEIERIGEDEKKRDQEGKIEHDTRRKTQDKLGQHKASKQISMADTACLWRDVDKAPRRHPAERRIRSRRAQPPACPFVTRPLA